MQSKACTMVGGDVPAIIVSPLVYNPSTLQYEWMKQPTVEVGDLTVSMSDVETLLADAYWKQKRYDYTSGNLDYAGHHTSVTAATSDAEWRVYKYTWSGTNITRIQGPITGAWDDRATLAWG